MSRFLDSFRSEITKVFATKMWWILALVIFAYSALMAGVFAAMFGAMPAELAISEQKAANVVYATVSSFSYVIPLLFGALMATTEIRHKTITLAFLAEPRREVVLVSKILTLLIMGVILASAGLLGAISAGAATLSFFDMSSSLLTVETLLLILRIITAIAIWAVIGFGLGLLIKNQAGAIVIALVFTQFLEPMLRTGSMFWEWSSKVAQFFPGSATDAFVGASFYQVLSVVDETVPTGASGLTVVQGGLVLLALATLVTLLGWVIRWNRDVQ